MAWVAFDRGIKAVEKFGLPGPVDRWREQRDFVHAEVCARGFDSRRKTFTQYYGSPELDASLLMLPLVGFLSADDPRIVGTLAAIERELTVDGFVLRYRTSEHGRVDGLPHGEAYFCRAPSGWLTTTCCKDVIPRHASYSRGWCRWQMTSDCSRRNTCRGVRVEIRGGKRSLIDGPVLRIEEDRRSVLPPELLYQGASHRDRHRVSRGRVGNHRGTRGRALLRRRLRLHFSQRCPAQTSSTAHRR